MNQDSNSWPCFYQASTSATELNSQPLSKNYWFISLFSFLLLVRMEFKLLSSLHIKSETINLNVICLKIFSFSEHLQVKFLVWIHFTTLQNDLNFVTNAKHYGKENPLEYTNSLLAQCRFLKVQNTVHHILWRTFLKSLEIFKMIHRCS